MLFKLHFLYLHLDFFQENLGDFSKEKFGIFAKKRYFTKLFRKHKSGIRAGGTAQ